MTIIDLIFDIMCILLGFVLCYFYYEVIEKDNTMEKEYWKYTFKDGKSVKSDHPLSNEELKPLVDIHENVFDKASSDESYSSEHFFNYDLSKQDFVITGDRHADTIEKSFSKNEVKHAKEYWKYTFKDGESVKSDHPLSNEEMKPLVDIHEEVKPDGLEVIKV